MLLGAFFRLHVPVAADLPFIHTRTRKGPPSPEEVTVVQALIRNDSEVRLVWVFLISLDFEGRLRGREVDRQ